MKFTPKFCLYFTLHSGPPGEHGTDNLTPNVPSAFVEVAPARFGTIEVPYPTEFLAQYGSGVTHLAYWTARERADGTFFCAVSLGNFSYSWPMKFSLTA